MDFERKITGTNIAKIYEGIKIEGVWEVMSSFSWNSDYSYMIATFDAWDRYVIGESEIFPFCLATSRASFSKKT